jgi:transposase
MIRSTSHSLKFSNLGKVQEISVFLVEYRRLADVILTDLWDNGLHDYEIDFSVQENKISLPSMLPNEYLKKFDSWLTARMKQCVGKQVCSIINAAVRKRQKQLFMLRKLRQEGKNTKYLQRKIDIRPLVKPRTEKIKAELDSRFVDFQSGNYFDLFVRIKTIGNNLSFNLPVKHTKVSRKWSRHGLQKQSIRLSEDRIVIFFEVQKAKGAGTKTVGADQGYKTVLSLSDGQITQKCPHGHDLVSIQAKLSRRKKGSKGFKKAQDHRTNYINWSLNQLNFSDIKEVRLEKVKRIRYKKSSSRVMTHWTYTVIKKKLESLSEVEGFNLKEVPNEFRSQRCNQCGMVRKSLRKGKTFKCDVCGYTADSDLNAASNLELDLFEIPAWVRLKKINREGFYWMSDGLFTSTWEPIVSKTNETTA